MANTLKFGNGNWATKEGSALAYNDENGNFKPLPFSFERDSKATVINKDGLIEVVGSGQPRIDYKDDSKGALLLEPSRTNYISPSINLSNWANFSAGGTVTTTDNYEFSPDGTQNASRIEMSGGNSVQWTYQNVSNLGTFASFYVKSTNSNNQDFRWFWNNGSGGVDLVATSEWQRFEVSVSQSSSLPMGFTTHSNLSSSDILVYGVQVEQGSYATSYIPTQGSAVTRLADICNYGGNEQVINSTEGVLYAEISSFISADFKSLSLSNASSSGDDNRVMIGFQNSILYVNVRVGNVYQFNKSLTMPVNNINKIALKYKTNDFALWVNGSEVATDNSGTTFSSGLLKYIQFADGRPTTSAFEGNVKDVKVYNTALTDQELAALTQV